MIVNVNQSKNIPPQKTIIIRSPSEGRTWLYQYYLVITLPGIAFKYPHLSDLRPWVKPFSEKVTDINTLPSQFSCSLFVLSQHQQTQQDKANDHSKK